MTCNNCGGKMIGDGYTTVFHCESAAEALYQDKEPDAKPVTCSSMTCVHCNVQVDYDDAKACKRCGGPLCKRECPMPEGGCRYVEERGDSL